MAIVSARASVSSSIEVAIPPHVVRAISPLVDVAIPPRVSVVFSPIVAVVTSPHVAVAIRRTWWLSGSHFVARIGSDYAALSGGGSPARGGSY